MKNKNIIISTLFALAVAVMLTVCVFAADDSLHVVVENEIGIRNNTVEVDVVLRNNPGISYIKLDVKYDSEQFEIKEIKNGEILSNRTDGIYFIWTNDVDSKADGVLATLCFDVRGDADCKNHSIEVDVMGCHNASKGDIDTETSSGELTVYAEDIDFVDVKEGDWFFSYVKAAVRRGLVLGVSANEFAPYNDVTRAMFVTLLYNIEFSPDVTGTSEFEDVDSGSWYHNAIVWAASNNLVMGVSDTEFAPDENITREQMATLVYRYVQFKNGIIEDEDTDSDDVNEENVSEKKSKLEELGYYDAGEISEYAADAFDWVVENGIIKGISEHMVSPKTYAQRAQAATLFVKLMEYLRY